MEANDRFPVGRGGVSTRAELKALGWSAKRIRHFAETVGQVAFPDVFVGHNGPLDPVTWLRCAAAWAGPTALLTGLAALEVRGFQPPGRARRHRFLVSAPHWCREHEGAELVRTTRPLWPVDDVSGIQLASVARSLVDVGRYRELARAGVRGLTIKLLQRGWVRASDVRAEIRAGRRNGTLGARLGVDDFTRGAWSLPEAWLAELIETAGLPRMLPNPELRTADGRLIGRPDGYFPAHGVAVQVHSREFHSGEAADGTDRWARTVEHDSDYAAHGILVVGVAPTTLRDDPERFLRRLVSTLEVAGRRPLPLVRAIPNAA